MMSCYDAFCHVFVIFSWYSLPENIACGSAGLWCQSVRCIKCRTLLDGCLQPSSFSFFFGYRGNHFEFLREGRVFRNYMHPINHIAINNFNHANQSIHLSIIFKLIVHFLSLSYIIYWRSNFKHATTIGVYRINQLKVTNIANVHNTNKYKFVFLSDLDLQAMETLAI